MISADTDCQPRLNTRVQQQNVPKLLGVIFVISTISGVRNSWRKLMTKTSTRRLSWGNLSFTKSIDEAGVDEDERQASYRSRGIRGVSSSRSQSFNRDAATWGSSIPCYTRPRVSFLFDSSRQGGEIQESLPADSARGPCAT